MKKIFVIDDDVYIGDLLQEVLTKEGYAVSRAYSGTEALLLFSKETPDLVLLDLMLPGLSGEEVLAKVKDVPIIVVSAKADVDDKVSVLLNGAADYVTKPFDMQELSARIAVQLRNTKVADEDKPTLCAGDIAIDTAARRVTVADREIHLTRTEYAVLKMLLRKCPRVVTKSELMDGIGADTPDGTESSLKIHVANLRKKLKAVTGKEYIDAVWGIGFKLSE